MFTPPGEAGIYYLPNESTVWRRLHQIERRIQRIDPGIANIGRSQKSSQKLGR
ncbi:MAG TPA: hypothetical protein VK993_01375 [Chthoniobacterales bacterium]|nr:hypothetical protein [Chthoniobacterales bacterium]